MFQNYHSVFGEYAGDYRFTETAQQFSILTYLFRVCAHVGGMCNILLCSFRGRHAFEDGFQVRIADTLLVFYWRWLHSIFEYVELELKCL